MIDAMKQQFYVWYGILCLPFMLYADSPYRLSFYLRPYPILQEAPINKHPGLYHRNPGMLNQLIIQKKLVKPVTIGVAATYNGMLAVSDSSGLITFVRGTQRPSFYLMIGRMVPQYGLNNNIEAWLIPTHEVADLYLIEQHTDAATDIAYWDVRYTNIPASGKVPLHTIVIHAKKENIYVPIGITPTTAGPNLLLPPLYVKEGIDHGQNPMFIMNIKQYFAPMREILKKNKTGYQRWVGVEQTDA
ncbi:hypothetical protein M1466_02385 [Candidatus Dependentiae bacterium]|nr:hypothetical protein [Candidatus Dependentiae bacterium]